MLAHNTIHHLRNLDLLSQLESNTIHSCVTDPPYGWKFMGRKWDYEIPSVEEWKEVYRVLKPGAYALVCCGTRTQHRMAVNLEDAGFEIRDVIAWVYGSGFPKSLNLGKAIDDMQGNDREVIGTNQSGSQRNCMNGDFAGGKYEITKGQSEWEGWGTALKPAMELWTLCRKPFKGNVASNVLMHHTGAINIDASRVPLNGEEPPSGSAHRVYSSNQFNYEPIYGSNTETNPMGRYPANFIHDGSDEVTKLFPSEAGAYAPVSSGQNGKSKGIYGDFNQKGDDGDTFYDDSGSAARFFYCAKASEAERNEGLYGFEVKVNTDRQNDSTSLANRLHNKSKKRNNHPTVKPVRLMRYLCRLITPPGGTVIDPFCGSGTTVVGAIVEGFNYIACDDDINSINIARARELHHKRQPDMFYNQPSK